MQIIHQQTPSHSMLTMCPLSTQTMHIPYRHTQTLHLPNMSDKTIRPLSKTNSTPPCPISIKQQQKRKTNLSIQFYSRPMYFQRQKIHTKPIHNSQMPEAR
jgi:hypothetical protein